MTRIMLDEWLVVDWYLDLFFFFSLAESQCRDAMSFTHSVPCLHIE
jgi:hypothetical protein